MGTKKRSTTLSKPRVLTLTPPTQAVNSLVGLGVNYILLYDSTGKFVAGIGFNLTTYQQEPIPDSLLSQISESNTIKLNTPDSSTTSVLVIPSGPIIVALNPIPSSTTGGFIQGVLVLARYFDSDEITTLSRTLQLPVTLKPYSEWQTTGATQETTFSQPVDTNYIVGYDVVKDLNNQPAILLGITIPRTVYVQGIITVNYVDQLVLVSCVVFSVTIILMLEFLYLAKLSKLTHAVSDISHHKNPSERLPTKGNDEIETLKKSINNMLGEIEDNNTKLQKTERFSAIGELATMVLMTFATHCRA